MQSDCLQAALEYAEKFNLSVIPIRGDKKPFLKWEEFQKRRATPEEIKAWWAKWPTAMIGIVCGEISGIFVVDCDNEESYKKLQELLPDSFITCIVKSPRGYHIYLVYPKSQTIGNAAGVMPGVDIRGEGGYIIAPPSINAAGKVYSWQEGLSLDEVEPAAPASLYNIINISLYTYREKSQKNIDNIFEHGKRDDNLFHIAHCLAKTGNSEDYVCQTLAAIMYSWGETDKTWIDAKVKSAFKRIEVQERNLTQEVRDFIVTSSGFFLTSDVFNRLQVTSRQEKKNVVLALLRLHKEGIIERHGQKDGCYRLIDRTIEYMDFLNADIENTVDVNLPLSLHTKTKIFPKGIVVVAGVSGMGKTLFALNAIAENMGRFPIFYFNSEMGPEALKQKLSHFPIPISEWATAMKVIDGWDFGNIPDKIQPDAFNVIDYLEPEGDKPYNIHGIISAIIRRLSKGTALITIQKKPGSALGTGGIYSIKAATLALSMEWGKIEIVKNRFREADPMPSLNKINFEVHQGYKFVKQGTWYKA